MSRTTHEYAQCNGCFKEERMEAARGFGGGECLPEGWVTVRGRDGALLWDLCGACHKEVALVLFAKERIDRVLEQNNEHYRTLKSSEGG